MLILINTAKTFAQNPGPDWITPTLPAFEKKAQQLVDQLKALTVPHLAKLMKVSPSLAQLNHERYAHWAQGGSMPALQAFAGEIYKKLKAKPLTKENWTFAQKHLRILSGLYGLLKPMDGIQPYRLEMYTKLKVGQDKDLYAFWKPWITDQLNRELAESGAKALVNLASEEYFSVIDPKAIQAPLVTVEFKERTAKGLRTVAIRSKWARGAMARYILDHQITTPEGLKGFNLEGYQFEEKGSEEGAYLFVRKA